MELIMERKDVFNERMTELNILSRVPVSFVVVGKPGCGKTTMAKRLASVWKCQLVNEVTAIEDLLKENSPLARKATKILSKGDELDELFVADIISRKLESPEIQHYGYVLDCLPSYECDWKTIEEQIEFIKKLKQSPDVIINLKIPDVDLRKRRVGQKIDPLTGEVFIKALYDPDTSKEGSDDNNDNEDDEEEEAEEDELITEMDEFSDDLGAVDELQQLAPDIADRLVVRKNDDSSSVQCEIAHYREHLLRHIEDYIIQHSRQYVIELDANLPPIQLFRSLLIYLSYLGLPRATAPKRLVIPDDSEEDDETAGMDTDQFLTHVSSTGVIDQHFRWKRSLWGKYCPVEVAGGNIVQGQVEFAVGLLDKMYCLSSAEALVSFYRNPRHYLLPPNPRVPCKICVLGPPSSGKSSLAAILAKHFNAMVVDVQLLMYPVMKEAQEKSVTDAKEKAKQEVLARLLVEQEALRSENGGGINDGPISEEHPEILEAMKKVERQTKSVEPTAEMFIEAFSVGVKIAEKKRKEDNTDNRSHGGWIIDGYPLTRGHWSSMIDANLLPDAVISLENTNKDKNLLLKRFCDDKALPDPSLEKKKETEKEDSQSGSKAKMHPEVEIWQKRVSEFNQQWGMLSEAIKGSSIDPVVINCSLSFDEIMKIAVKDIESVFQMPVVEADDDADIDDDPVNEEEDAEDDDGVAAKTRKPWGDTSFYCPVALKNQEVLWPGNLDISARYKDRLYAFSTDEAKEKFTEDPSLYVAEGIPLQQPAPRILFLGPRGSGKTTIGRQLAKKTGLFHISFQQYLQDIIMPKMKRPPLVDEDDFEEVEYSHVDKNDNEEVSDSDNDLDEDVAIALTEKESEIRSYLVNGVQLQEEHLEELIAPFWTSEPYKSTGIILEGFPSQGDELRFLCSKGFFPDSVCVLETEENHTIQRLMPSKLEIWKRRRNRKNTIRAEARQNVLRDWKKDKAKHRAEIDDEYKQKKIQREEELKEEDNSDADEDQSDPFFDEYQEQIAELEAEDPPEEEEFEDEGEQEYEERAMTSLKEKHEEQTENINSIKEVLAELQISCQSVHGGRKIPIVLYCVEKVLSKFLYHRDGLFTKCTSVNKAISKKLLDHGYKQLSRFGHWCPVKLTGEPQSVLPPLSSSIMLPTIYRERIYYLSSNNAQNMFEINPEKYLKQEVPSLPVPIRIAVIGPPKSGKTTVANRFCQEYGCVRLSIGEAIRKVILDFPQSDLTEEILLHLKNGQTVPDELCVLALERVLLDVQITTRGYVLDGYPVTKSQISLLNKYEIIPVTIVELNVSDEQMLVRAEADRNNVDRSYAMHDSPSILMVKSAAYHKNLKSVKEWYSTQHSNWNVINGGRNNWYVWTESQKIALKSTLQIQQYLIRVTKGQAASIFNLCVTQNEFNARLGEVENYCPVCLKDYSELNDCVEQCQLENAIEYKGFYYRTCDGNHLQHLLTNPDKFVGDSAFNILPPPSARPKRISNVDLKEKFPIHYELKGFCPVMYIDGKQRFECLVPGSSTYSVEYKNKLYCFSSDKNIEKFMRSPHKYEQFCLPVKLPPVRQPLSITSLPMLGYMEQSVAICITNGLTAVGCFKPKFPFVTASQSAQLYIALHLKAYNPRASTFTRERFCKKLQKYEQNCRLISYLFEQMETGYKDPQKQTVQFKINMTTFLALST